MLPSKDMMTVFDACAKSHVAVGLIGDPGVGKSSFVESYAKASNRNLVTVSLSTLPAEDVRGIPVSVEHDLPYNRGRVLTTDYAIPLWQQQLLESDNSILFLDELSTACSATQHAFLQLIQSRILPCGAKIPESVLIIACINPDSQSGGCPLDPPLANRFCWLTFDPDYTSWREGMNEGFDTVTAKNLGNITFSEQVDPDEYAKNRQKAVQLITGYLGSTDGTGGFIAVPNGTENPVGRAVKDDCALQQFRLTFPSPRTWDMLANILSHSGFNNVNVVKSVMEGTIGFIRTLSLFEYFERTQHNVDIDKVIKNPASVDWRKLDPNTWVGLHNALTDRARNAKTFKEADAILTVYAEIKNAEAKELINGGTIMSLNQSLQDNNIIKQSDKSKLFGTLLSTFDHELKEYAKTQNGQI